MENRIFNFAAGPCTLPVPALKIAQEEFLDYEGAGMSLIEMSHRGEHYDKVHSSAMANVRDVLGVPDSYDVLLLQGGATLQFAMIPMNFLTQGKTGEYVNTGTWAKKAISDGKKIGATRVIWDNEADKYTRMPAASEIKYSDDAAYVHLCSGHGRRTSHRGYVLSYLVAVGALRKDLHDLRGRPEKHGTGGPGGGHHPQGSCRKSCG